MEFLFLLLVLLLIVLIWQNNLKSRELAIKYCFNVCNKSNLQLLDQTIAMKSIGISKWKGHFPVIYRKYAFEFSIDGSDRYNGFIIITHNQVELVGLEHPDGMLIQHQDNTFKLQ